MARRGIISVSVEGTYCPSALSFWLVLVLLLLSLTMNFSFNDKLEGSRTTVQYTKYFYTASRIRSSICRHAAQPTTRCLYIYG